MLERVPKQRLVVTTMAMVPTAQLVGSALEWALAAAMNYKPCALPKGPGAKDHPDQFTVMLEMPRGRLFRFDAVTNWLISGPLQDEKRVNVRYREKDVQAVVSTADAAFPSIGPTAPIAICRAIVASILGHQVSIPVELIRPGA